MQLTHEQKTELLENGFVQVPGVVPPLMIDEALRAINHSLGEGIREDDIVRFRSQSYCPEITGSPVIVDLLNRTPAWPLSESAIGEGKIQPVGGAQIALRFPGRKDPPGEPRPHLDGMHTPTNGVPEGTIQNFTMLVGIFLSPTPSPYSGSLTVWPRSHHLLEHYFQEHGPHSLLDGMPPIEMPAHHQIVAEPGDVVFCHYQLAHGVAPNASSRIRYAVFFRLKHVDHEEWKWETMTDIWREWEGIRPLLAESRS